MNMTASSLEEYMTQFNEFLDSEPAKSLSSITYIWKTTEPFNRVKDKSSIIYIGKTINTFRSRYKNTKSLKIEEEFFKRHYKNYIDMYGPLSIEIIQCKEPAYQEWRYLMDYFDEHMEYPPLNRSIPSKPSKID